MNRPKQGRFVDPESPRGYCIDYADVADAYAGEGIPETPAGVARLALGDLERYLARGTPGARGRFERAVTWLTRNTETIPGGFSGWAMPDPPRPFAGELPGAWFCGRVHAECLAVLVRGGTILGNTEAVAAARGAFGGFETLVDEGGFAREIAEEGTESGLESPLFIESYPLPELSLELLGHTTAMLAVHDYGRVAEPERAGRLFRRLADGLAYLIDLYDTGAWSLADLDARWRGRRLASAPEHRVHILHLRELERMTGAPILGETALRWGEYDASPLHVLRAGTRYAAFRMMNPGAPGGG